MVLGPGLGVLGGCCIAGPLPGLIVSIPTVGLGLFMLRGPLGAPRYPIARVTATSGPLPCATCGYPIQPPPSAACPECGGTEVTDEFSATLFRPGDRPPPPGPIEGADEPPSRGLRRLAAGGELGLALSIIAPAGFAGHYSAVSGDHFWTVYLALLLGAGGFILIGVPAMIAQLGIRGRLVRWWIPLVLLLLPLSIMLTNWPAIAAWHLSASDLEQLHQRVVTGESIDLPRRIGVYRIDRIEPFEDGSVGYFRGRYESNGLVRTPVPTQSSPGYNTASETRLDTLWWAHTSD